MDVSEINHYERMFVAEVIDPLVGGLNTTLWLAKFLQVVNRDDMNRHCATIRQSIVEAEQSLTQAEETAKGHVEKVDEKCVDLVSEKNQLQTEEKDKRDSLASMEKSLEHLEEMLRISKESLDQAHNNLSSAEESLQRAKQKAKEEESIRETAAGMSFIPFVGPIIGQTILGVTQKAIEDAEYAVKVAQDNVDSWKSQISTYEGNIQDYTNKIDVQRNEIACINSRILEISSILDTLSEMCKEMGVVQNTLQNATFFLTTLAGKMQAAEVETRIVIFFDPLINILDDLSQYLSNQKCLDLLQQEIQPFIEQLKGENEKLRAIRDQGGSEDDIQFL